MNQYTFDKQKIMPEQEIKFCSLDKITQQTTDEYLLRFNVPIHHDPGQFMQCSILGIGEAPISICSYSQDYFEMSIRDVGNVSHALCQLKKGTPLGLRGPYGRGYPMNKFYEKDIILIGGGCGVAPLRGIIEYLQKHREKFGIIHQYFGFRTTKDILFGENFNQWQKQDMHLHLALSEQDDHPTAKKGFITDYLEKTKKTETSIAFLCGPPIMMKIAAEKLIQQGFQKSQIWISEERHMKCGVGRCGHCMIGGNYCCKDGPVFQYNELF